eukprot:1195515-Prorocentrum_minimum.AAC.5
MDVTLVLHECYVCVAWVLQVDEEQIASTQAIVNLFFCFGKKAAISEEDKRKKEARVTYLK